MTDDSNRKSLIIDGKEYILTSEAAQRLKVTQARVRQLIDQGRLGSVERTGPILWVSAEAVADYKPGKPGRPRRDEEQRTGTVWARRGLAIA